jgi:SPX domain protein involved in polyphosphate accumulation
MKFAEKLAAHITPEWNSQYIKYDVRGHALFSSLQSSLFIFSPTERESFILYFLFKGIERVSLRL